MKVLWGLNKDYVVDDIGYSEVLNYRGHMRPNLLRLLLTRQHVQLELAEHGLPRKSISWS